MHVISLSHCDRFTKTQVAGCLLVLTGVVTAAVSPTRILAAIKDSLASPSLQPAAQAAAQQGGVAASSLELTYLVGCVLCFAFPALASVTKASAEG